MDQELNKKKVLIFLLIIWSIGLFLILILLEVALNLYSRANEWKEVRDLNIIRNQTFSYYVKNKYETTQNTIEYKRNVFGLRDDCGEPQNIDILTIGGSTTDQRYIKFESTYQKVLQELINENSLSKICVSNAGVDGHSTHGHIESFKKWFPLIPNLKPKYVFLYIGLNDADFLREGAVRGFDNLDSKGHKGFLKQFEIVASLLPLWRSATSYFRSNFIDLYSNHAPTIYTLEDYTETEINPDTKEKSKKNAIAFKKRLLILKNYINNLGSTSICITQPHLFKRKINGKVLGIENVISSQFNGLDYDLSLRHLNNVIYEVCGEKYTLDVYAESFSPSHFYDGTHLSEKGSEHLGRLIYQNLMDKGLLKEL